VNGDGRSDIIIGSPGIASAYVVFGKASLPAEFDLSQVDGKNGFQFSDNPAATDTGTSVAGAGDINHDGFADVLIGNPNSSAAYVIFGRSKFRSFFPPSDADLLVGRQDDHSGVSVAGAGDVNGDGFDDLMIGTESF